MFEQVIHHAIIEDLPIYNDEMSTYDKRRTCLYTCFLLKNDYLANEEELIFNNLSKIIVDISENNVRLLLAQEACNAHHFPEELALKLAYDKYEISERLLCHYAQFADNHLLRMIDDFHDEKRILLIANRPNLSFPVTDKLISLSKINITQAVLENETAKISIRSLQVVLTKHQHNRGFLNILYRRKDVSKSQIIELLESVDSPIKKDMIDTYWGNHSMNLPFSKLNIINLSETQIKHNQEYRQLISNIDNIYIMNHLNWHILLSYLIKGDFFSFIYGISKLTNMPFAKVKDVVLNYTETDEFIGLLSAIHVQLDYVVPLQIFLSEIAKELKKGELTPENYRAKITAIIDARAIERLEYLKKLI
ncbi:MAG: DUF2336 domain-containing protein [Rickettsiales bacterium]